MVNSATISFDGSFANMNENLTVTVFDLGGKIISQAEMQNETTLEIERDGMVSGIYLVRVSSKQHGAVTKRLMVQ
jgi:hypothetical protein